MQEHRLYHLRLQQQHVPAFSMLAQAEVCHLEQIVPLPTEYIVQMSKITNLPPEI